MHRDGIGIEAGLMKHLAASLRLLADALLLATLVGMAWWLGSTFAGRVGFPFDLEWMEGGMLLHAQRVRDGLPLYVAPSAEYIPFIYPPGYPWLVGTLGHVFELGYPLARAVSFTGTCVAALLLVVGVRMEGHRWSLGLGAAALFLSCYDEVGAFFDLVRTDGVQVALMAAAVLLCRRANKPALAAGGLALAMAYATKHNMALLGVPIAVALWRVHGWRRAAWFAGWSAIPALGWTLWLQLTSDGFFLTYIVGVPATHPLVGERLFPKAEKELLSAFPWPLAAAALPWLLALGRHAWSRGSTAPGPAQAAPAPRPRFARWYWGGVVGTGLLMVVLMRGHHGGYINVLIPGFWLLALVAGFGMGALVRLWKPPLLRAGLLLACAGLVAVQCWLGSWDRDRYQPTPGDLEAGQQVLDTIAAFDGPVLMPHSPYYPVMVGKPPSFALIALWDITHRHGPLKREAKAINQAIAEQRFDAIILASKKFRYGLLQHYEKDSTINIKGRSLYPKTGWRARPRFVYVPVQPEEPDPTGPSKKSRKKPRKEPDTGLPVEAGRSKSATD